MLFYVGVAHMHRWVDMYLNRIMLLFGSNAEPLSAVVGSTCSRTHVLGQHVVDRVCAVNVVHHADDQVCVLVVVQHVVEPAELCGLTCS